MSTPQTIVDNMPKCIEDVEDRLAVQTQLISELHQLGHSATTKALIVLLNCEAERQLGYLRDLKNDPTWGMDVEELDAATERSDETLEDGSLTQLISE